MQIIGLHMQIEQCGLTVVMVSSNSYENYLLHRYLHGLVFAMSILTTDKLLSNQQYACNI